MEKRGDDDVEQDAMIGSPLSDGKMVIKLKIPNLSESSKMAKMADEGKRVCLECGKEFSSGKALGGHMRVHVQSSFNKNKNPNFLKPSKTTKFKKTHQVSQTKPYYLNSVNHEGTPICSQCGKTFPSMKSLFGHMRCHPERVWRGILPPPNAAVNHRDTVLDLSKFLSGWSVTEKRGRRALKPAHDHQDDEVLLEAVEDLMSLAHGGSGPSSTESNITQKQLKTEVIIEGSNSNSLTNKDHKENPNDQFMVISKYKKRKKMKLMMELEDETKYKCTTCDKCFASHQALGGHRSSHNHKSKIITSEDDYVGLVLNENGENNLVEFGGIHQCKICDKVFATGQALGGHKRCHWTGTIDPQAQAQAQAPSSQITSAGEAASHTGNGKKVLDFDLNEIPSATSSSYNTDTG